MRFKELETMDDLRVAAGVPTLEVMQASAEQIQNKIRTTNDPWVRARLQAELKKHQVGPAVGADPANIEMLKKKIAATPDPWVKGRLEDELRKRLAAAQGQSQQAQPVPGQYH